MTMILTCLTKDYVVQVSDRRISYLDGKTPPKDDSNKAIVYGTHFVFAYTGAAQFGIKHTPEWAAQMLSESKNLDEAVFHLRDRANDVMRYFYPSSSRAKEKMIGFVGTGFMEMKERGNWSLKPLRIMISNFVEERNGDWSWVKEFRVTHEALQLGQKHKLFVSGRKLASERRNLLNKNLEWCLQNKRARGPETIGRFLAREILKAAEKDEYIGTNIMCTFVPRKFINDGSISIHLGGMFLEDPVLSTDPQQLKPRVVPLRERLVIPPPFNKPYIVYIDNSDTPLPGHTPKYVWPGMVVPEVSVSDITLTIPPVIPIQDTREK